MKKIIDGLLTVLTWLVTPIIFVAFFLFQILMMALPIVAAVLILYWIF